MKTLKLILFVALIAVPFLHSCDDDQGSYPDYASMCTVKVIDDNNYYFQLDNDDTVYPLDKSNIPYYSTKNDDGESKDGKRTIIYYSKLDTKTEPYTNDIALYYGVIDILTKPIDVATTELELAEYGDDPIVIENGWTDNGWLNILFVINQGGYKSHRISMVDNKTISAPEDMPEGYQYLELRHDDFNDLGVYRDGYVSYKLSDEYNPEVTNKKGFYIKVSNFNGDVKYVTIDAETKGTPEKDIQITHSIM